jgi:hypothetical protein
MKIEPKMTFAPYPLTADFEGTGMRVQDVYLTWNWQDQEYGAAYRQPIKGDSISPVEIADAMDNLARIYKRWCRDNRIPTASR